MTTSEIPLPVVADDPEPITFSARDLAFELSVTGAILRSLEIDQIVYVVLSGVTSGEGLGFNRGVFMLVDQGQRMLRTSMAIGPINKDEAHRIWEDMKAKDLTLNALLTFYDRVKNDPTAHSLTHRLSELSLSLSDLTSAAAHSVPPEATGQAPILPVMAHCLLSRRPLSSSTLELIWKDDSHQDPFVFRNWSMVPLVTPDHIVGMLVVDDAFCDRKMSSRERHLLLALANLTAIAVEKGRLFDQMRSLAEVDGLTGLANRRAYDASVSRVLMQARQTGRSASLIVFDIDHFKRFNDDFGHLAGDDVLRFIATIFRSNARRTDILARYGGEEFVVLLPDTPLDQAIKVAKKLVRAVREQSIIHVPHGRVTVSGGVATSVAGDLNEAALFQAADRAVYQAKRSGRDRVRWMKDES